MQDERATNQWYDPQSSSSDLKLHRTHFADIEFDYWGLYWVSFQVLKALKQPIWIDFIQNKHP